MLPQDFATSLSTVLDSTQSAQLIEALEGESPVSVRFNPFKLSQQPEGERIAWSRYGYMLDRRPSFTLDPMFHGGAYYVQEASSMFIEHLFRQGVENTEGIKVLDLCAAPGGKTTLLSTLVGLEGLVVANEVIRPRAMTLSDNVRKWGLGNVVVTNNDPSHFEGLHHYFDVIAVDAPCSGEGMFRKSEDSRNEWSPESVNLCAQRQRRILSDIWASLKPGGVLIYSTCTFNRTENEENIAWLTKQYDCEGIEIDVPENWGIVCGNEQGIGTYRFYPHRVKGEGFFAAIIRKCEAKVHTRLPKARRTVFSQPTKGKIAEISRWVNQPEFMQFATVGTNIFGYYRDMYPAVKTLSESLSVVYSGVMMGQVFGTQLKPEHSLALFHDLSPNTVSCVELELDEILNYLRKQDIDPGQLAQGINLLCYEGLPIGWVKRIGQRANNLYPKELRIISL